MPRNCCLEFNVLDFGARGDGTTNDLPAFEAAMAAARISPGISRTIVVPGDRTYRLAGDLDIVDQLRLTSFDGSGEVFNSAILLFDIGFGIKIRSIGEGFGSAGFGCEIDHIAVHSTMLSGSNKPAGTTFRGQWQPNTAYAVNDIVLCPTDNRFVFTCTRAGTSGAVQPMHDSEFDDVGGPNTGLSLVAGAFDDPNDGSGTLQWTTSTISGIRSFQQCNIHDVEIRSFTNAGIYLFGSLSDPSRSSCSFSTLRRVQIGSDGICGCGVIIEGGDASRCYLESVQVQSPGDVDPWRHPYPGPPAAQMGGHGFVSKAFYGQMLVDCLVNEGGTGFSYFAADTVPVGILAGSYAEGDVPLAKWNGFVLSNVTGFVTPHPAGYDATTRLWHQLVVGIPPTPSLSVTPRVRIDDEVHGEFFSRTQLGLRNSVTYFTDAPAPTDDQYRLAERYQDGGAHDGYWIEGLKSGLVLPSANPNRDVVGWSTMRAPEGKGHFRRFWGELRGYGPSPIFVAYAERARHDVQLRKTQGVGGHYRLGDRYLGGDRMNLLGKTVIREGWQADDDPLTGTWSPNANVVTYDFYDAVNGAVSGNGIRHPTTPDGFTYAASRAGTASSVEPDWSSVTHFLDSIAGRAPKGAAPTPGGDPVVPYEWAAEHVRKVGDYGAPSVRNGHYYRVTAVSSANADGYAIGAASEPAWDTGPGSTTVDGGLTWTEQGSDANTYLLDGTIVWQCVGPEPIWSDYWALAADEIDPDAIRPTDPGTAFWIDPASRQLLGVTDAATPGGSDVQQVTSLNVEYTFPSDADQTLSAADSRATSVIVQPGVITTTRRLTSALRSSPQRSVTVQNLTDETVEWGWSSGGTVVPIPSGKTAMIVGTGAGAHALAILPGPPSVSAIAPALGDTAGFTSVTITGKGFSGATGATVGGVPITSFSVVDDATITGVTGAHPPAADQSVVVDAPWGSSAANALYEYFDPTSVPNLSIWHRADLGVTESGGTVSTWTDQSGNGIDLTQGAPVNQPFLFAAHAGFHGRPALGTNGVDATLRLNSGAMSIAQPSWAFYVFNIPTAPTNPVFFGISSGGSNANAHDVNVGTDLTLKASDSGDLAGPTLTAGTTYVVACRFDTGTSALYVNRWSTPAATGALSGDTALSRSIGCFAASQYLVAEGFEYERDLTGAEVQKIVQYLGARYAVPVSA